MEYETLRVVQGYAKFTLITIVFIVFYSYAYSIYKRQKTGERDYEKYSKLVLDDDIESEPLEKRAKKQESANKDEEGQTSKPLNE